jgi:hypothetical protein
MCGYGPGGCLREIRYGGQRGCFCSEQIFQFKNPRSNVAYCAEVLEQHRECRVMEAGGPRMQWVKTGNALIEQNISAEPPTPKHPCVNEYTPECVRDSSSSGCVVNAALPCAFFLRWVPNPAAGSTAPRSERAAEARKEADKLACDAWTRRMLAFKGPAQPSPHAR